MPIIKSVFGNEYFMRACYGKQVLNKKYVETALKSISNT
jgi:hypothetical protein